MTKKISQLNPAAALDGTELVELEQASASVRTTAQDIADLGGGGPDDFTWSDDAPTPTATSHDLAAVGGIVRDSLVSGTLTGGGGFVALGSAVVEDAEHFIAGGVVLEGGDLAMATGTPPAGFLYLYAGEAMVKGGDTTIANGADLNGLYLYGARARVVAGSVTISGTPSSNPNRVGGRTANLQGGNITAASMDVADAGLWRAGQAGISGGAITLADAAAAASQIVALPAESSGGLLNGGSVQFFPGSVSGPNAGVGGDIDIRSSTGASLLATVNGSALIERLNDVVVPITGVAVSDAAIHAALVTLRLITA